MCSGSHSSLARGGPDSHDCSGLTMVAWAHAGVRLLYCTGDFVRGDGRYAPGGLTGAVRPAG